MSQVNMIRIIYDGEELSRKASYKCPDDWNTASGHHRREVFEF